MRKLIAVFALLLLISGCEKENSRIRDTVIKYDTLLAEGYRNLNMTPLTQVATEKRAAKAYYHMAALGEGRIKMDARLRDIKFLDIKTSGGKKSEVTAEEMWDYAYIDIESWKQVFDNSVTYKMKYVLEKKSDEWLVADITIEKAEEKKSSEDFFESHRRKSRQGK